MPKFMNFLEKSNVINGQTGRSENVIESMRNSPKNKTAVKITINSSNLCSPVND